MAEYCAGWILDVYIENDEAVVWIKTESGKVLRLTDEYEPSIYILPTSKQAGQEIIQILSNLPMVDRVEWKMKVTSVSNPLAQKVIHVATPTISHSRLLQKVLKHETLRQRINTTFNSRVSHLQHYLFTHMRVSPSSKISIEYEESEIVSICEQKDNRLASPFSVLYAEIDVATERSVLDGDDPIIRIKASYERESPHIFEDSESVLLQQFIDYIFSKDPDVIVFANETINILPYLLQRTKALSLNLMLGRRKVDLYSPDQKYILDRWTQGRIYIPEMQLNECGVAGLIELSRFSHLPIRQVLSYGIGRHIANRIYFELFNRDYIIPDKTESNYEHIRLLGEIVQHDKGGMIFSPRVGLNENVAVLDFNDEFGNIIVNNNISFETVRGDSIDKTRKGILPEIVRDLINCRSCFRSTLYSLPQNNTDYQSCQQRFNALKQILVCIYGTTGSFWNKYGNVLAFEKITRISRQVLLKTKDIAQSYGFEIIYADTDAAFVHKDGAKREDYESLRQIIADETGLSIALEYHYKFLVLLPLEADERLEALKHYFGITYENQLVTRGIETRRHDAPSLIKQFQTELLLTLFDCNTSAEIYDMTLEKAQLRVTKTIDRIMTGEVNIRDLIISKKLRMDLINYKSVFPHVAAAMQQRIRNNKGPERGDNIQYIYTDSENQNPMNRVLAMDVYTDDTSYDKEKYKEILLDAAETVLGIFGFDRTLYGKPKVKKWWEDLRRNKLSDINAELISNES
jgi:DNA polymerase elongation subunit (family B)